MNDKEQKQKKAIRYFNSFSKIYDWVSSKSYYYKPRELAIKKLKLERTQNVLNIPCGTGQNFKHYQNYFSKS